SQVVFCGQGNTNSNVEYTFEGGGTVAGAGGWDNFIASYDTAGNFKWSKVFQSIGDENMLRLTSNHQDKLYAIGKFNYRMFIDSDTVYTNSYDNAYVTCLDTTGQHQWTLTAGGTQADLGNDIGLDNTGAVYVLGATSSDPCYFGALEFPKTNPFSMYLAKISDEPLQNSIVELQKKLTLYPNPNAGNFTLQCDTHTPQYLTVYSMLGECVFSATTNSHPTSIPIQLPPLPDGLYILKASSEDGNFTQTFLVKTP
nr:T9SS type A sorting domain-containing protein [Chitinophagaceae bacterium]